MLFKFSWCLQSVWLETDIAKRSNSAVLQCVMAQLVHFTGQNISCPCSTLEDMGQGAM